MLRFGSLPGRFWVFAVSRQLLDRAENTNFLQNHSSVQRQRRWTASLSGVHRGVHGNTKLFRGRQRLLNAAFFSLTILFRPFVTSTYNRVIYFAWICQVANYSFQLFLRFARRIISALVPAIIEIFDDDLLKTNKRIKYSWSRDRCSTFRNSRWIRLKFYVIVSAFVASKKNLDTRHVKLLRFLKHVVHLTLVF